MRPMERTSLGRFAFGGVMGRLRHLPARLSRLPERVERLAEADRTMRAPWHHWYKTAAWRRLRWKVLRRDLFLCQMCGVLAAAKGEAVADHKTPHRGDEALFWDENNLQCLCKTCHDSTKQRIDRAR